MKFNLELGWEAAEALVVAILQDNLAMYKRAKKKKRPPLFGDEQEYIEAAKVIIRWHTVQR